MFAVGYRNCQQNRSCAWSGGVDVEGPEVLHQEYMYKFPLDLVIINQSLRWWSKMHIICLWIQKLSTIKSVRLSLKHYQEKLLK